MRVAVDARPLSHPQPGGYRTHVAALVQGLAALQPEGIEILLYLDRPIPFPLPFATRILSPSRLKTDFFRFAQQVRADRPDLVHGTVNYLPLLPPGTRSVLTLLDALLLKRYPWEQAVQRDRRQRLMNAYWAGFSRLSARRATRLLTLSHGAAAELAEALHRPATDFRVVYNGLTLPLASPGIVRERKTVLAIASPDPRKNLPTLYAALALLGKDSPSLELVCTSARAAERAEAETKAHGLTQVRFLRTLSDQALADTYARATVFVFPSWQEGFGLPPLEAMQSGCPVIASSAAPLPEILGEAPLYAAPDQPAAFADALQRLLRSPAEQAQRAALGRTQAARYSLRAMAEGTVALWREVCP